MNKIKAKDGERVYIRVSKTKARQTWDAGKPIILCPVKLWPFGGFRPSIMVQACQEWPDFDYAVRNFEWYNCTNETGRYPAYYVERDSHV